MSEQTVSPAEAARRLSDVLSAFAGELMRYSMGDVLKLLRREDLSMPRLVALMYVDRRGAASISDINEYLNLSLGTTSHIVDQLVCGGYASRTEDPHDRRLKQIALTPTGQAFVEEVKRTRVAEMARRLEDLPPDTLERALAAMGDVVEHLRRAQG